MASPSRTLLFGGSSGWQACDWTASDDRVRGGRSHSALKIHDNIAVFCGNLDIDTLGGAGFASQRTTGDERHWNMSKSDAVEILVVQGESDDKRYTFVVKDEILPRNPENGREQSTTSWEHEFKVADGLSSPTDTMFATIVIPWDKLKPTYRGKVKDPERPLILEDVRRISIMMRSYFGDQHGDFCLSIASIAAVRLQPSTLQSAVPNSDGLSDISSVVPAKASAEDSNGSEKRGFWSSLWGFCNKL